RQVIDKRRDIYLLHSPAILCSDLYSILPCYNILPAITRDMIIDPQLYGSQESRFTVITTSNDKGNPFRYPHPSNLSFIGELELYLQFRWSLERYDFLSFKRMVINSTSSG